MVGVLYALICKRALLAAVFAFVQVTFMVPLMLELKDAGENDKGIYMMMWVKLVSAAAWIQLYFMFKDGATETDPWRDRPAATNEEGAPGD